jgi:hypothetical protein
VSFGVRRRALAAQPVPVHRLLTVFDLSGWLDGLESSLRWGRVNPRDRSEQDRRTLRSAKLILGHSLAISLLIIVVAGAWLAAGAVMGVAVLAIIFLRFVHR